MSGHLSGETIEPKIDIDPMTILN